MTAVKLICPTGRARYIPAADLEVAHGATVELPPDIAGRPPKLARGKAGDENYTPGDLGEGLLAQSEVWGPGSKAAHTPKTTQAPGPVATGAEGNDK
jgi:hypothetical protein